MKNTEFQNRISKNPRPMIVDIWAPWCTPCRAMEPAFKQTGQKYTGQVDILKINADDSPDVVKALGVSGIPTVMAFAGEKLIMRRTGMQSAQALEMLFEAALNQRKPAIIPPAPVDRIIRTAGGLALIAFGWFTNQSYLMMGIGGVLLFSAVYDRCPIYRAIVPRLLEKFQK
ncbi:MAG: thioredoxin domain-containing protein [Anaerolineaceae bacterium]